MINKELLDNLTILKGKLIKDLLNKVLDKIFNF